MFSSKTTRLIEHIFYIKYEVSFFLLLLLCMQTLNPLILMSFKTKHFWALFIPRLLFQKSSTTKMFDIDKSFKNFPEDLKVCLHLISHLPKLLPGQHCRNLWNRKIKKMKISHFKLLYIINTMLITFSQWDDSNCP